MLVYTVWVSFEAMVTEKTFKEELTNKKYFHDNYNLVQVHTMNIDVSKLEKHHFERTFDDGDRRRIAIL